MYASDKQMYGVVCYADFRIQRVSAAANLRRLKKTRCCRQYSAHLQWKPTAFTAIATASSPKALNTLNA